MEYSGLLLICQVVFPYFPMQKVVHVDNEMCKVCGVQIV